jgi:hypothetical protein
VTLIGALRPRRSTVLWRFAIEEGGLTATRTTISSPFEIPPRIPPALLVLVLMPPDFPGVRLTLLR